MQDLLTQEKKQAVFRSINEMRFSPAIMFIFYLNLYFTIMRLQDFPGFSVLGSIRLPAFLTALCCFFFISYAFSLTNLKIIKIMLIFIFIEGLRGIFGFLVYQDFVVNDALQFYTWRDLVLNFLSMIAPVVYVMGTRQGIRKIVFFFLVNSFFLGLWSITHGGRGPGGYLGDENDNCLYLLTLIPMAIFSLARGKGVFSKIFSLSSLFLLIGGVIMTNSRGGFLGFVAIFAFLFLVSKKKLMWILSFLIGLAVIFPFVPEQYYLEIKSIQTESGSKRGTIRERLDTWGIIYDMWSDPRNMIQGVGLSNSKFNMGNYQYVDNTIKSLAGRQAHSLYFQILGDLGIWGIFIYGSIIWLSIGYLRKIKNESLFYLNRVNIVLASYGKNFKATLNKNILQQSRNEISDKDYYLFLYEEIEYVDSLSRMLFCSWIGLLVSGVGISVSYYPTIFLLPALSLGLYLYFLKLTQLLQNGERPL